MQRSSVLAAFIGVLATVCAPWRPVVAEIADPNHTWRRTDNALHNECYDLRHMFVRHLPTMSFVFDNPEYEELKGKPPSRDADVARTAYGVTTRVQYRDGCRVVSQTATAGGVTTTSKASFDEAQCRYESSLQIASGRGGAGFTSESWYDFSTGTGGLKEQMGGMLVKTLTFTPTGPGCYNHQVTELMAGQVVKSESYGCGSFASGSTGGVSIT